MRVIPIFGIVCLAACSGEGVKSQPAPADSMDFSEFDAKVEAFVAARGLPGASAVVVHEDYGIVHERGYGGFAADRLYLVASSSKILSVGVLMRLADDALLELDAPIADYLGAWGVHKSEITLAQLLSNSSGLVGLKADPMYAPYLCQFADAGALEACAKAIYTADDQATRIEPDTKFIYGGAQWQLAGGIAEVVSGKRWAELVEETYAPCDTPSLGYTNQFRKTLDGGQELFSYPSFFSGDVEQLPATANPSIEAGVYVTARDYGRVLQMHLRRGLCGDSRVLSESGVKRMQEDRIWEAYKGATEHPYAQGYGLGWWIHRFQPGVVSDGGAYGSIPWLDVPRKYGAILILESNSAAGAEAMLEAKPALDAIFDGLGP